MCRRAGRGTLAGVQRIARGKGGECLSKEYVSSTHKLEFVCEDGHEFSMSPAAIRYRWCPWCGLGFGRRRREIGIEDLQQTARARGGECLSKKYSGVRAYYRWQCARKHVWRSRAQPIRAGHWCAKCSHSIAGSIDGFRAHAVSLGGECLSPHYENNRTMLRFRCARRHRFELMAAAVKTGVWCPTCAN